MLLPKRVMERDNRGKEVRGRLYKKSKQVMSQLGHFNKNTRQKITSKKGRLQMQQKWALFFQSLLINSIFSY